jgi:sulfur relay (sulfurtransferase) DsrC/TusE family protein
MGFWDRLRGKPNVGGYIAFYGLVDWWLSEFSEEERRYIDERYDFFGAGGSGPSFASGEVYGSSGTAGKILWAHGHNFIRDAEDRTIAERILLKAASVEDATLQDRHFAFMGLVKAYYKDRDAKPDSLRNAIRACESQIAIAPEVAREMRREYPESPLPKHIGFEQLAVIREKRGEIKEALRLSEEACRQGWAGFDKRIARLRKRLG